MSRHCRFCHTPLTHTFADLGLSPLSNSYVKAERLNQGEVFYPLHAWVCPNCQLVQLEEFEQRRYDITRERLGGALNLDYRPDSKQSAGMGWGTFLINTGD